MARSGLPHLVLVDDDDDIRQLNVCAIEGLDLGRVTGVDSVRALLAYLEQSLIKGDPVDLILMDIMMPEVNGIEGCQKVHELQAFRDIPIVMLTSMRDEDKLEQAFNAGATDYIIKPFSLVELRARVRSALRLKQEMDRRREHEHELLELTRSLIDRQAQSERTTYLDAVTGIYNRRAFDKKLHDEWLNCYSLHKPLAMILLDIDFFKRFNDCYGHPAGDRCLQAVASCLPQPETGIFSARYGGEEFALILPGYELEPARDLAEQTRRRVEKLEISHVESDASSYVTISLGIACGKPHELNNSTQLVEEADQAMYRAKAQGRNKVC
ncbi:MAG TPA: diguanylate cyclase [Candidatus Obscuribacterales bacterium]